MLKLSRFLFGIILLFFSFLQPAHAAESIWSFLWDVKGEKYLKKLVQQQLFVSQLKEYEKQRNYLEDKCVGIRLPAQKFAETILQ